jgi:tetratricopeptide (TPR) repeat protein
VRVNRAYRWFSFGARGQGIAALAALAFILTGGTAHAQVTLQRQVQGERQGQGQGRIDVQSYLIEAQIDPAAQTITASAMVRFIPLDDTSSVSFELNNALNLSKVLDAEGRQIPASRSGPDMTIRVSPREMLPRGKVATLTFVYDGKLTGNEESPVFGIKFAAIHPDFAYLMYPARWFPVSDYTADRFSSDLKVTVPAGFKVVASDSGTQEAAPAGMAAYRFNFEKASFPGNFAVVRGDGKPISAGGVTTFFYLRESGDMAQPYGEEFSRAMTFFTDQFGLPPKRNLTVVETEEGAPKGYCGPGIVFLSPQAIGKHVDESLVADQVARQWWGNFVSPTTRNHLWIENGLARYSDLLYNQHVNGDGAFETARKDNYIAALTVEQPPLMQSARLEDYSPEFWAATASKGAAVLHMLRYVMGDDNFFKLLKAFPERYPWGSANTDDFHKLAEEIHGDSLNWFFIEWIESNGAPEFKMKYTTFRYGGESAHKGFRVMGSVTQDMDTFRMPITIRIETEGNPEEKKVEVVGMSSEFSVDTFGKPKLIVLDPKGEVLHFDDDVRVAVAIRKGEQFVHIGQYNEALREYQKALEVNKASSLAHYRVAEVHFLEQSWQSAAEEYRQALTGDATPKWVEVWSHIGLGHIYDISDQRERALNEYRLAVRTKDDTAGALEEADKCIKQKFERPRMTN